MVSEFSLTQSSILQDLAAVEAMIKARLRRVCGDDELLEKSYSRLFHGRGKMLRPRLTILSGFALRQSDSIREEAGGKVYHYLLSLAAISELIHNASLIHDDVLDEADERRGLPSINASFGNKIAVLAGDILYSQAFEMLVETTERSIILKLTDCVFRMCDGEIVNLTSDGLDSYKAIIEGKTASLMKFCCEAGAAVARREGDAPAVIKALEYFGYNFGMVYQLADDLSDKDCSAVLNQHDKVVAMLQHHRSMANKALDVIPGSEFKEELGGLLQYVVNKAAPYTGNCAPEGCENDDLVENYKNAG